MDDLGVSPIWGNLVLLYYIYNYIYIYIYKWLYIYKYIYTCINMSPIHGAYAVHRWMFWLRKAGRKVALEVQPNCQGPMYSMCIPSFRMLVVPGTFSVSCLPGFRNGLTSTPMLGCPGEGVFWSWFSSTKSGRFSHENIFNQDVFVRKEENWAWQLYVILGFYNVILCFGLYFSIHTKKK